jgi:hypothetical protein
VPSADAACLALPPGPPVQDHPLVDDVKVTLDYDMDAPLAAPVRRAAAWGAVVPGCAAAVRHIYLHSSAPPPCQAMLTATCWPLPFLCAALAGWLPAVQWCAIPAWPGAAGRCACCAARQCEQLPSGLGLPAGV